MLSHLYYKSFGILITINQSQNSFYCPSQWNSCCEKNAHFSILARLVRERKKFGNGYWTPGSSRLWEEREIRIQVAAPHQRTWNTRELDGREEPDYTQGIFLHTLLHTSSYCTCKNICYTYTHSHQGAFERHHLNACVRAWGCMCVCVKYTDPTKCIYAYVHTHTGRQAKCQPSISYHPLFFCTKIIALHCRMD